MSIFTDHCFSFRTQLQERFHATSLKVHAPTYAVSIDRVRRRYNKKRERPKGKSEGRNLGSIIDKLQYIIGRVGLSPPTNDMFCKTKRVKYILCWNCF